MHAQCAVPRVRCPWALGSWSPVCPLHVLCRTCAVLGHLAPIHWCACPVCCAVCAVSLATWLLLTTVPAQCVVWRVRCPWTIGSAHLSALPVCCVFRSVSLAPWLAFTGVPARCIVLCARCPGPLGSCSPVCRLGVLCVRCRWPVGSCSAVCQLSVLCGVGGVLGHFAPVHGCARRVCCVVRSVSLAPWLPLTGVPARCVVLCVACPWPLGSWSLVGPPGVLCCVSGVLGHLAAVHRCTCAVCCVRGLLGYLAPVHRSACSVCCVACAVS